jgi:hypothetical protein
VASTGLWAHPKVHQYLLKENGTGAFFPNTRRYRINIGERKCQLLNGYRLDDNSYANHAVKQALGLNRGDTKGFEACHIWPGSTYDPDCHTVIANLILLPRPLAGLSDHFSDIQAILKYRAFQLYGWFPPKETVPLRPDSYPIEWKEPFPYTKTVERSLNNRKLDYLNRIKS